MNDDSPPQDLTPQSASPTDIAPLGRGPEKPSHEKTAAEEAGDVPWMAISQDPDFRDLLVSKARFVMPATAFFVVYYFALPILVGWFPEMMGRPVIGAVNLAYLFALSQFFMAWVVAFLYVAAAMGWDRKSEGILRKFGRL